MSEKSSDNISSISWDTSCMCLLMLIMTCNTCRIGNQLDIIKEKLVPPEQAAFDTMITDTIRMDYIHGDTIK